MVPQPNDYGPDVLDPNCPTGRALGLVADKWTLAVVFALARGGTRRHSELRRDIAGVSQKVLTQVLRALEREEIVTRTIHPTVPPMVEYDLTPRGRALIAALEPLRRWAESAAPTTATA